MREHNRLAREIAEQHPDWTGDQIYDTARRIVGAQMQVITYREFLPLLLGPDVFRVPGNDAPTRRSPARDLNPRRR